MSDGSKNYISVVCITEWLVAFNEKYSFLVLNSTIFIALYTIKIEKTEIDYEYR